jgi:hypothetical protein
MTPVGKLNWARPLNESLSRFRNEVDAEQLGLHSYFNFRSLCEQAELKEPAWA